MRKKLLIVNKAKTFDQQEWQSVLLYDSTYLKLKIGKNTYTVHLWKKIINIWLCRLSIKCIKYAGFPRLPSKGRRNGSFRVVTISCRQRKGYHGRKAQKILQWFLKYFILKLDHGHIYFVLIWLCSVLMYIFCMWKFFTYIRLYLETFTN